jgi:hypothetical protein
MNWSWFVSPHIEHEWFRFLQSHRLTKHAHSLHNSQLPILPDESKLIERAGFAHALEWLPPKVGGGPTMIKFITNAIQKEGNPMTMNQAAAIRVRWKGRADLSSDCEHLNLELEWNDLGCSTGDYTCIICGELVLHKHQEYVSH